MDCVKGLGVAMILLVSMAAAVGAEVVAIGAGACLSQPRAGDRGMPPAAHRDAAVAGRAAPTNQWYSSLVFSDTPEALYVQPLTVRATPAGFEMALPVKEVVPSPRHDVEIHYPHRAPLLFTPTAFPAWPARLAGASDWAIDMALGAGADAMRVTVAHGSPFASFRLSSGDVRLRLPAAGERIAMPDDPRVLALSIGGQRYAAFGPTGVRWEQLSPTEWIGHLPAQARYWSAAALPDATPQTLALFARHAYAFIEDTHVDWHYVQERSQVETTYAVRTQVMEGPDAGPLLGLYPHHWFGNASVADRLGPAYDTVRGRVRLLEAAQFRTVTRVPGFVPWWPGLHGSPRDAELADVMKADRRTARRMMLQQGQGAYWQGKGLQRTAELMHVLEQQGDAEGRDELLAMMERRMEEWLSGASSKTYFACDRRMGAVASYPDEFFTVEQINDHHFTYGYWIRAAAEVALRDPAWAARERWGGMIDLLAADIATAERGRADFPFLRNFDVYEGHSWASGIGMGALGNNQESSSEAVNAWAGLMLWGEATGNRPLRDLGAWLYATEIQSVNHYWFDLDGLVLPPEYKNVEVSQLFGGAMIHNTWWTDEPRQIKGINLLPITTASLYLGQRPEYVRRNMAALKTEMATYAEFGRKPDHPPPADIWQDIYAEYLALADPSQALRQWDRWGSVEVGDSRAHTLHWMLTLDALGLPDATVVADTPFHTVLRRADGHRTYLAFNAGKTPITVHFSDGHQLEVAPGALAHGS